MKRTKGLGRGLGALLGESASSQSAEGAQEIAVEAIVANQYQPRSLFDRDKLQALVESIREHGIVQPIVVTRLADGSYSLIAGERRWRAAQLAGLATVPAVVREATDQQRLELALIENLQRADLNPLEEATAFRRLADEFSLTQDQVAQRVGRSRTAVANSLRLLQLPDDVKGLVSCGDLSEGHARALLGLPDPVAMTEVAAEVIARDLTVRQTEDLVRSWTNRAPRVQRVGRRRVVDPDTRALEDRLRAALGTRVQLERGPNGGKLTVYFHSEEELDEILRTVER